MISIKKYGLSETRHFMDDERQISVGIDSTLWPVVEWMAGGKGESGSDRLGGWVIREAHRCPGSTELWEWIEAKAKENELAYLGSIFDEVIDEMENNDLSSGS